MDALLTIILCIVIVNVISYLLKRLYVPHIVSLILTGLFLGLPQVRNYVLEPNTSVILMFGDLGILFSMFLAGMNSSKELLNSEKLDSLIISIFAGFIPFAFVLSLFMLLGFPLTTSLVIAVCMSITAEASNIEVLLYLKKLKTKVGSIIVEAGLFDDVIGLIIFLVIQFVLHEASVKDDLMLIAIFAMFFLGVLFQKLKEFKMTEFLEQTAKYIVIPFFFISMGLHFNFEALLFNPLLLIFILSLGIIIKLLSTLLAKRFVSLKTCQLYLIGWAMNSRGEVELVLAFVAFRNSLIGIDVYSSLIMMALLSTLIFPVVVSYMIKKQPNIMTSM